MWGVVPQKLILVALMMTTTLIIVDKSRCAAGGTNLWESKDSNIIANKDQELEFQMDSESNRRALLLPKHYTVFGSNNRAAICHGPRQPYFAKCFGPPSDSNTNNCQGLYNRDCGKL